MSFPSETIVPDKVSVGPSGPPLLSLVVPFYNEQEMIPHFFSSVIPELERMPNIRFEILCVNDGSRDRTLDSLIAYAHADARVRVVDLTRNFGKEAALTAAIFEARGDLIVPFDAENVGDFRLFTRNVANALKTLPESCRFMKGLFAWVGFKTAVVEYKRAPRAAGKTKFSGWKLWNFALEGITSFSTLPLRIWTYLGVSVAIFALTRAFWLVIRTMLYGVDVPGYASLATAILLLGGIQLIGIGVLGEYVGRIYLESKRRPVYLVRKR
jgi:glycosyltransferase involved in cell wall biosynthesis